MTDTIDITDDYVVGANKHLDFTDQSGFMFDANHDASLVNRGSVSIHGEGDLWDFRLVGAFSSGSDFYAHSVFWNQTDANFRVKATGEGDEAFGYLAVSWGPDFRNDGHFTVQSTHGDAWGVSTASPYDNFFNTGVLRVTASGRAVGTGLEYGQYYLNSGRIIVHGGDAGATAMGMSEFGDTLDNSGRIIAQSDNPDLPSVGVSYYSGDHILNNSGFIQADRVVVSYENATVQINNTGVLIGAIDLVGYDNKVVNNGKIVGDLTFHESGDSYDGKGGSISGEILGGLGDDTLSGGNKADLMHGDEGASGGDDGADMLSGRGGDDSLFGDGGKDTLSGGMGADTLSGGGGADHFVYLSVNESTSAHSDLITDLDSGDVIDLSGIDADRGASGDQAFVLVGALDGHAGQLALSYDAGADTTFLRGDVDGDGQADLVIALSGDQTDFTGLVL